MRHHDVAKCLIAGEHRFSAADLAMHHVADIDAARALNNAPKRGIEIFEGNFGEKSQRAKIYTYDRNAGWSDSARGREQGAIATKHDYELELTRGHLHAWHDFCVRRVGRG